LAKAQPSRLTIRSDLSNLGAVSDFIAQAAQANGLNARESYHVQMAADEAVTNVIEHAYRGRKDGRIDITYERRGDEFIIEVRDFGQEFDPSQVRTPRVKGPLSRRTIGGLGVFFMRKLMDGVEFSHDPIRGNRVRMVKKIK
jgi:serine/threonine-protein kinase RsbW